MASVEVSTMISSQSGILGHLIRWVKAIPRAALLSMIGPSLLLICGYLGWRFYGAKHYDATFYGINKANIEITKQPDWIRTSVVDQVYDENSLGRLSLFDSQTPSIVARAFSAHPVIRKTQRVQPLSGGKVQVSVEYRMPVAMVCVQPPGDAADQPPKWHPIDGESYILPTKGNFTEKDVNNYIWILANGIRSDIERYDGRQFEDPQIRDAASLCAVLVHVKDKVQAKVVKVTAAPATERTRWALSIDTHGNGPRILWGSAPGMESTSEPKYDVKLKRLLEIASDRAQWSQELIDLTQ